MDPQPTTTRMSSRSHRVLAVADWNLDPHAVVAALVAHDQDHPSLYGLLVPAGLHGLDWAGEPNASRPCAGRQLARLGQLLRDAGIPVQVGTVGAPEAGAAISDAVYDWPADEILFFARDRKLRLSHPLSLARRVERATGVAVTRIGVAAQAARRRFRTAPQCEPARIGSASR
jgi:hypothetical protein